MICFLNTACGLISVITDTRKFKAKNPTNSEHRLNRLFNPHQLILIHLCETSSILSYVVLSFLAYFVSHGGEVRYNLLFQ